MCFCKTILCFRMQHWSTTTTTTTTKTFLFTMKIIHQSQFVEYINRHLSQRALDFNIHRLFHGATIRVTNDQENHGWLTCVHWICWYVFVTVHNLHSWFHVWEKTWHLNWFLATRVMQTMGTSLKLAHPGKWFLMNLFHRFSCILNQIISSEQVHWWSKKLPHKPRKHRMSHQPFCDVVMGIVYCLAGDRPAHFPTGQPQNMLKPPSIASPSKPWGAPYTLSKLTSISFNIFNKPPI